MDLSCTPFQRDGSACLRLNAADGAVAEICLHGAHVLSWQPTPGRERLYLSPRASLAQCAATRAAIRGGIPVIFPQFGGRGPMVKHGFARLLSWRYVGIEADAGTPGAVLELIDNEDTRRLWPARFRARLHVALAPGALTVRLAIGNQGEAPFSFTAALHTYLRVDDLDATSVQGLEAAGFEDTRDGRLAAAEGEPVRFQSEVDRLYPDCAHDLLLAQGNDAMRISADGFRDTVLWNPGAALAAGMADLGAGEHRHFVCVESGTIAMPVTLAPGEEWSGAQRLQV
ncbi:D-hexose-6-phosphate mutarotase [Lysobacter sp. S4-A87]|uniref:D-hexose-6-phosphate mutarotase n=1 Tax=Lysobacter sp. S4-A87 TaxID=2925843 RepID=UPI001F53126D|nr:D-hexose-6-phosphate mutarotase [Lysobacter sp. S4-A87]UNK50311.1 D-hexose-6-phosphate mutarotase [Lysobacter sp. S4-A87]